MNDMREIVDDLVAADAQARAAALDPSRSFIVQAPAGSGKTELLIQRYLRLLATVEQPEEVVAMTFTRKAAGEMRERVLKALAGVKSPAPKLAHERLTWTLARDLLAHSKKRGWALDAHSSRLAIQTIDAWCMRLTRNAPLASGLGLIGGVADDTTALYAETARRLVFGKPTPESCVRLLSHLDNQADRLIDLIAGMLAQRDQWLPWLVQAQKQADLRDVVQRNWRAIGDAIIARADGVLPPVAKPRMLAMLAYARDNLIAATPSLAGEWPTTLTAWPAPSCDDAAHWQRLIELILTKTGTLRKQISTEAGFPAPSAATGAEKMQRQRIKGEMGELLDTLRATPGCADAWKQLHRMPDFAYTDAQWDVVEALLEALPLAAAQLRVVFAENDVTDFTELSLGALQVLGDESAPSDVLLAYDQKIRHLLVDEFQDTSLTQFALVSKLTSGWSQGDGRTLFAVGDPMQSVYRFRGAEVGLFLDSRETGIGDVRLQPLQLRVNFRSKAPLVEWVNDVFGRVLPDDEVPDEGVTRFVSAVTPERQRALDWQPAVRLHGVLDEREQGRRVVELIRTAQAERPNETIAILVRTRNHLRDVIPALRDAGIAWQAVDIDPLASKQSVIDCMALTHALLEAADRLAWLAILRAPWCGLTLADLTRLVAGVPSTSAVLSLLCDQNAWSALSDDGRARLARCAPILVHASDRVSRGDLGAIEAAWLRLGGPATLSSDDDLADVERYWRLLSEHARVPAFDWQVFVAAIDVLFGEPPIAETGTHPVQIMTMHKAKGLEFGTVIAPGLAQPPGGGDPPLLRWRATRSSDGQRRLLVAPIQKQGDREGDSQYEYLRRRANAEERHELGRLLYVTATRAQHALHWLAVVPPASPNPFAVNDFTPRVETSLALMWEALGNEWPRPEIPPGDGAANDPFRDRMPTQRLCRLPADWRPPALFDVGAATETDAARDAAEADDQSPPFDWAEDTARAVGIVAHDYLRRIATDGLPKWSAERVARMDASMRVALAEEGVPPDELDDALDRVRRAVSNTLASARAGWLFDRNHVDARSEYAVTTWDGDRLLRIVVDRTFIDGAGVRWIIDFKTSLHRGADLHAFLDREVERHRPQLESYARAWSRLDPRPIKVGVYWPLHDEWREWSPVTI
jgi:ATP-dependent exoDNAse (exonuclease V) beta subunit